MSVGLFAQTIGPKEEITINNGCVGEHYQVLGGGNGASWRTVGNSDNYTITVESLNGEIIDNLRLEVYSQTNGRAILYPVPLVLLAVMLLHTKISLLPI